MDLVVVAVIAEARKSTRNIELPRSAKWNNGSRHQSNGRMGACDIGSLFIYVRNAGVYWGEFWPEGFPV